MKSIQNQYRDLKEGRMSQANFMRNLRMTMPQYVTNVTSFNDAVKILKNKSILTETLNENRAFDVAKKLRDEYKMDEEAIYVYLVDDMGLDNMTAQSVVDQLFNSKMNEGNNSLLDEVTSEMENGNSYAEAISKVAASHNMSEDKLAEAVPEESVGDKAYADNYEFDEAKDGGDDEIKTDDEEEILAMLDKIEQEKAGEEAINAQWDIAEYHSGNPNDKYVVKKSDKGWCVWEGDVKVKEFTDKKEAKEFADKKNKAQKLNEYGWDYVRGSDGNCYKVNDEGERIRVADSYCGYNENLSEAKKKKKKDPESELHPNQIHPQELRMGIKVELEHTDELDVAKKIALDHLKENPFYYTALKLSGIESPSAPKTKAPVEKKAKKKETVELVDKENQMKPVPKKKLKEVEERMMFQDEPADPEKYQIKKDMKGKIIQATNDEGDVFSMNDEATAIDNGEKIKIAGFKEEQGKVKAIFKASTGMFFSSIDIDGLKPINKGFRPGVNLGGSFEKFKSSLEEVVREVVNEMQSDDQEIDNIAMELDEYFFDGRDNLADEIAATEK